MKEAGSFIDKHLSFLSEGVKENSTDPFVEVSPMLAEDLGVFFILNLTLLVQPKTVDELKDFFSSSEELAALVDQVLVRMEEFKLIEIKESRIKIICHDICCNNADAQLRFLASLFKLSVNRVLEHQIKDPKERKSNREVVCWSVLPDDVEVSKELREINCEYMAKLRALEDRHTTGGKKTSATKLRFNGLVNVLLGAEDFD